MKRILCAALGVMLFAGSFGLNASAKETTYQEVLYEYADTATAVSDDWSASLRGAYLLNGTSSITRSDSTHIHISGSTNATKVCDKVVLSLYVERSTSYATGYSTYKKYTYTEQDTFQIAKEISNIAVESGYYYRVKGVHSVTHNGTTETTNSVTNPIDYR